MSRKDEIIADESRFQDACSKWVYRNIGECVSSLMYPIGRDLETAAKLFDEDYDEMMGWFVREDWEEPVTTYIDDADLSDLEEIADMVGYWSEAIADVPTAVEHVDDDGDIYYEIESLRIIDDDEDAANEAALDICIDDIRAKIKGMITNESEYREIADRFSLDPEQWEVYEHWTIPEGWTARDLEAAGELVFDFCGLRIWGRCATGQSISLDGVIRRIVKELDEDHWIWSES